MEIRQTVINTYYRIIPIFLYDAIMNLGNSPQARKELIQELNIQNNDKILDVSIGTGLSLEFYPPDTKITAIDINPRMISHCKKKADRQKREIDIYLADAKCLPFQDSTFDKAVVMYGLSAIPNNQKVLSELKRVLKSGGYIGITDMLRPNNSILGQVKLHLDELVHSFAEDPKIQIVSNKIYSLFGTVVDDSFLANYILRINKNHL